MIRNPSIYIGIDGGGTRSVAVAVDSSGTVRARARAGSLNFFGSGIVEARRNLEKLLEAVGNACQENRTLRRVVIGCAALFENATPAESRLLGHGIVPLKATRVVSDSQTAHFGATLGAPGIVVIAGTGSIVLASDERGRSVRIGGWGHWLGDEGSACWLALEGVKAAIAAAEGRGPKTRLSGLVRDWFQMERLSDIVPKVYRLDFAKHEFASLAGYLAGQLGSRDAVFRSICLRAGRELAMQASAAARLARVRTRPLPVCLIGSVLTKNAAVRASFVREIRARIPIRIIAPRLTPALGAAAMALLDGGVTLTPTVVVNLAKSRGAA